MGKNKGGGNDRRARDKKDHRSGARGKGYMDNAVADVDENDAVDIKEVP